MCGKDLAERSGSDRTGLTSPEPPAISCLVPTDELRQRANRRFERALEESGARDPRDFYRDRLRDLRARDEEAFLRAVEHYEQKLLPAVAEETSDPLVEWLEYGRLLAELTSPGKTVQIDPSGRAVAYEPPVPHDHLVLHLPDSSRERAVPVGLPASLSPAQSATYQLLVKRSTA